MNYQELVRFIKDNKIEFVDYKFVDVPGIWQHVTDPIKQLSEDSFISGIPFDGSSIRGFQEIHESDMLLVPDIKSAFLDPFTDDPTLSLICNVKDPVNQQLYSRDPRYIGQKALRYLQTTGVADTAYFGPELEFYIFDDIRFEQTYNKGFYYIDSIEGRWNSGNGDNPNLGYKPRYKEGYFPLPPTDHYQNLRAKMTKTLMQVGVDVEKHHHEVGSGGQGEIGMRFNTLVPMADDVMKYKYVLKNVALRAGKTVTFMPKPLFMDNGSGMHTHQSLWKGGRNLFFDAEQYAGLSMLGRHYTGGILRHASSLLAFCAPTTNSYRRLVPGYEAPINLVYSMRNRSAGVRIPVYSRSENAKRIEVRFPDPSCNPYLAFASMLMAGLDGIEKQIEPPPPVDKDIYELEEDERADIRSTPGSLEESIEALEDDHEYLMKGGVFTEDLLETWISYKKKREIDFVRLRPHPAEFDLYYDV
jgi:glutamine synthetase